MKEKPVNKLKVQQEITDQYSSECERVAYSDEYFDIVVEYENIEALIKRYNAKCYKIIENSQVILSIPVEIYSNLQEDLATFDIPFIYGPDSKESMEASGILYYQRQPLSPLRGKGVLIGIVDSGIDYTHRAFINEDGTTKITRIWDQTIPGDPPEGFSFGSEYTRDDINEALKSENPYDIVPSIDESGHGTFLAGLSAGREVVEENFIGAAPDAELIIVKLKEAKKIIKEFYFVENINQVYQDSDIIQGINYVANIAKALNKPLALCFGLSSNLSAHDGTAKIEDSFFYYVRKSGYIFNASSGNEAIAAHHYRGQFMRDETIKDVEINVAEGEKGIYFSIWCHSPDKISISMTSPLGGYIERIPSKFSYTKNIKLPIEQTTIYIIYELSEAATGEQLIFIRMLDPTPGIWTITIYGEVIINGRFDMWLPRVGWVKEETVFTQPDPFTTVAVPGTGVNNFTIGGYDVSLNTIFKASGRGLTWDYIMKPDIVAPSVNVYGPVPSNKFGTMTGTSVGSAITGGASALLLEWGIILGNLPQMNTAIARNFLIRGAKRKKNITYPNPIWGYGQLDLIGTFESLKGIKL